MSEQPQVPDDPRFVAMIDLIGRTGAKSMQVRFSDDQQPIVWMVVGEFPSPDGWHFEAGGGLSPLQAGMRLLETVLDGGGTCAHCSRPCGVWEWWEDTPPLRSMVCWYVYDPELEKFRRSCEGETTGHAFGRDPKTGKTVGRNDLCPCGSGKKWKRCHGA